MHALIVEDERLSADRLKKQIQKVSAEIEIMGIMDSVASALDWFRDNSPPDLVFLDIQLNDGTGFDLLNQVDLTFPVIFTTAYDNYAIKAFKFNGVDYLLKPVDEQELRNSIQKVRQNASLDGSTPAEDYGKLNKIITGDFKKRFLIKIGDQFQSIAVGEIAFFEYSEGMCYTFTREGKRLPLDYTMDQLESLLNPLEFFRINRQLLISLGSIKEIHSYFNSRLLLKLSPQLDHEVIVSRDRVNDFKCWMDL